MTSTVCVSLEANVSMPFGLSLFFFSTQESPFTEIVAPIGGQLTLGSTLGYCSGVALRVAGRLAAAGVGGTCCIWLHCRLGIWSGLPGGYLAEGCPLHRRWFT